MTGNCGRERIFVLFVNKEDAVYLRRVRECICRIEEDIAGGRDAFMASHTIQDAVLRNLQTMAEATQRLSDPVKERRPEVASRWGT